MRSPTCFGAPRASCARSALEAYMIIRVCHRSSNRQALAPAAPNSVGTGSSCGGGGGRWRIVSSSVFVRAGGASGVAALRPTTSHASGCGGGSAPSSSAKAWMSSCMSCTEWSNAHGPRNAKSVSAVFAVGATAIDMSGETFCGYAGFAVVCAVLVHRWDVAFLHVVPLAFVYAEVTYAAARAALLPAVLASAVHGVLIPGAIVASVITAGRFERPRWAACVASGAGALAEAVTFAVAHEWVGAGAAGILGGMFIILSGIAPTATEKKIDTAVPTKSVALAF